MKPSRKIELTLKYLGDALEFTLSSVLFGVIIALPVYLLFVGG